MFLTIVMINVPMLVHCRVIVLVVDVYTQLVRLFLKGDESTACLRRSQDPAQLTLSLAALLSYEELPPNNRTDTARPTRNQLEDLANLYDERSTVDRRRILEKMGFSFLRVLDTEYWDVRRRPPHARRFRRSRGSVCY